MRPGHPSPRIWSQLGIDTMTHCNAGTAWKKWGLSKSGIKAQRRLISSPGLILKKSWPLAGKERRYGIKTEKQSESFSAGELDSLRKAKVQYQNLPPWTPMEREQSSMEKTEYISIEDFAGVDIRVGEIISAELVPKADRLPETGVKLGDEVRQIVVIAYYSPGNARQESLSLPSI